LAYKLNEQRLTPGSLNLLVPADQNPRRAAFTDLVNVPQGECLDLTDWWPGSDGHIEQAPQFTNISGADPTPITSICQSNTRTYYAGQGKVYQIGRGQIDSGYSPVPLAMISFQGYCWFMSQSQAKKDNGTTTSAWTPAAPASGPALSDVTSSSPIGGYGAKQHTYEDSYVVTWLTDVGETNPSPANVFTPSEDHAVTLITQPAGAPANAYGWNVYRRVPPYGGSSLDAQSTFYLLNSVDPLDAFANFNTGSGWLPISQTGYQDTGNALFNQDDASLLLAGTILEADKDPAPLCSVLAQQTYNGRIVAANSAAHPNRIYWTPPQEPAFFPGSADTLDGNWADIGTDSGDGIVAITVRPGMLVIYRQKSIWQHLGDLGDSSAVIQPLCPDMGLAGMNAVACTSLGDYFVNSACDGLYLLNNDWPTKLSAKVEPIFRNMETENFPPANNGLPYMFAVGFRNGRVYVGYPASSGYMAPAGLIYHVPSGRWFSTSLSWGCFLNAGSQFLAGGPGLFLLESVYTNTGTSLAFQSQYHDCGLPDRMKTWADLVLTHNTQGTTMTITCRVNKNQATDGSGSFVLATFISTSSTTQIFPLVYPATYQVAALRGLPIKSYNLSIRITGPGNTGNPIYIETPMLLHYYVEARVGRTFDSGPTSHGLAGAGIIDQIEIDGDFSNGAATLTISSDIPGGTLVDRTGTQAIVGTTNGRQIMRIVLANLSCGVIFGRLFRHQLASTVPFAVYAYRVRVLPIGVYADGTQGDFWFTEPVAPGTQQ